MPFFESRKQGDAVRVSPVKYGLLPENWLTSVDMGAGHRFQQVIPDCIVKDVSTRTGLI